MCYSINTLLHSLIVNINKVKTNFLFILFFQENYI